MSRPLKDFIGEIKTGGLARTSRFSVDFSLPSSVQRRSTYGLNLRKILLFCDTAQLPGVSLSTTQSRTFGEFRELPYEKLFDNVSLTFYVDTDMSVKSLFDDWIASIQDPETKTFSYYKDYTTDFFIDVYDIKENRRYGITLFEAYPKSIGSVTLDYASKEVMKLQVNMIYRNWTSDQYAYPTNTNQFEQKELFSINGKLPSDYLNNFKSFQGKFNDNNNVFQNNSLQIPSQNVSTEIGSTVVDYT